MRKGRRAGTAGGPPLVRVVSVRFGFTQVHEKDAVCSQVSWNEGRTLWGLKRLS
jgi:hypothetical protein